MAPTQPPTGTCSCGTSPAEPANKTSAIGLAAAAVVQEPEVPPDALIVLKRSSAFLSSDIASLHLLHQVITTAHGERHDCQRRILTATRDE